MATLNDIVEDLRLEQDWAEAKIQTLSRQYSKLKYQDSTQGTLLGLQIATLSQYAQILKARWKDMIDFETGIEYTAAAGFACKEESCDKCVFDPDTCELDADRTITEDDCVLEILDEDDSEDDFEDDDDEDFEDEDMDEGDCAEDDDFDVTVFFSCDRGCASCAATDVFKGVKTEQGEPELVKKPADKPKKKIVVKQEPTQKRGKKA